MEVYQINNTGKNTLKEMNKKSISEKFNMHTRDLRPVLLPYQLFTISVRGEGILVNLGMIKMIIGVQEVYLFNTKNEKVIRKFTEILAKILKNEKNITDENENHSIPFEFLILEAGFLFILEKISGHFEHFEKRLEKLLEELSKNPTQISFEKLLQKKKEISRLEKSAQEIQNALDEVLVDEEEIEELWISKAKQNDFEEDDVESILENLLEQVTEISHKIVEKKENIDDTQEIVTLKMASIRNTIIQYDLILSALTGILAVGTLISGFYGMNVVNPHTNTEGAFSLIIGIVLFFSITLLGLFLVLIKKKNIWQVDPN